MKTLYTCLVGAVLATSVLLAGCADPADETPDAVVGDATTEAAPAAEGAGGGAGGDAAATSDASPDMETTTYVMTPDSSIGFVGSKVTGSHDGGFEKFSGTITVPGDDLNKAQINVTIDMNSTFSDNDKLTTHLLSPDFFEVEKFPESTFASTAITADGDNYKVTGNFTFHGVTKSITFPAAINLDGDTVTAQAEFDINRFDFGVEYPGKADDLIRPNVVIKLDMIASK